MAKKKKQKVGICHNPACPMCDIEQFFDEGQELKCSCCPEPLEEIVTGDNGDGTESTKKPIPWKRIGVVGIALALLVAIVWFIFFREPKPNHLEITLSKESITLNIGDSEALSEIITILSEDDDFSVSYVSDNISVARVDNQGTVHAISKGEANVTVIAQTETGIADTVQVKVAINERKKPIQLGEEVKDDNNSFTAEGKNDGTYNLGWGTYSGPMKNEKPHGKFGKVTVTSTHTIDLESLDGAKIIVYSGDVIVTNFENGRLRFGEVRHKDGSSEMFSIF